MSLITSLSIANFKCFKKEITIPLKQSTYLIGSNNSGKTSLLDALNCFFDSSQWSKDSLNKTIFVARQAGHNKTTIAIEINVNADTVKARSKRLGKEYKSNLPIQKTFTYREKTNSVIIEYKIKNKKYDSVSDFPPDVKALLKCISPSYIHPQHGENLLLEAQTKLKERLFNNWGRHKTITAQLISIQKEWDKLKKSANKYLSASLNSSLQDLWPESTTTVKLPEKIQDIVSISEITFKSHPDLPEIAITSQGTGAQSTVLYQTHYVLDSDGSLHRNFHAPLWLLEEPESFLHTDLAIKLGRNLASKEWSKNIQMLTATHSAHILATSKSQNDEAMWIILDQNEIKLSKTANMITDEDLEMIGKLMGDPNFDVYFNASELVNMYFIEDTKPITVKKYEESGILVKSLKGTSEIVKHLETLKTTPQIISKKAFYIIDQDKGIKSFKKFLTPSPTINDEFELHEISHNLFLLLLPQGTAVEHLFDEYQDHLESCYAQLYNSDHELQESVPSKLSRTCGRIKGKKLECKEDAIQAIVNEQEVKDYFWEEVEKENYQFNTDKMNLIKKLLQISE